MNWRRRVISRPAIVAWAATSFCVALAIAPAAFGDVQYDPALAVLTATLIAIVWYTFFTYALVANAREEAAYRQLEDQLIRTQLAYIARTLDVVSAEEIASAVVLGRSAEKMLNFLRAPTQAAGRARLFQWTRHFDALKAAAGAAKGTLAPAAVRAVEVVRASYDSAEGVDNAVVSLEDLIGRVKRIAERSAEANLVLPQFGKSE